MPGIEFVSSTASKLPFDDASFSRVVSRLTFHEVKDVRDKAIGLTEAIRVLKSGGRFAFVDLFDDPDTYHGRELVIEAIAKAGGELESARCLSQIAPLKWPMDTGKALKYAVVVAGTKRSADYVRRRSLRRDVARCGRQLRGGGAVQVSC